MNRLFPMRLRGLASLFSILILVAWLSHKQIPDHADIFSVEGMQLGTSRSKILEHWQLDRLAKADGDILALDRDGSTGVIVYFRDSQLASIFGETLNFGLSQIKAGDSRESVRATLGSPSEVLEESGQVSRDLYESQSGDGTRATAIIIYYQGRVLNCLLTYTDCRTMLEP